MITRATGGAVPRAFLAVGAIGAAGAIGAIALCARPARAAEVEARVHFEVAGAHFLSLGGAWQGREIGLGGVLAGAFELGLTKRFGLEARLLAGRFVQGDAPTDPSFQRVGSSGLLGGAFGFRLHPFADLSGAWLGASIGVVRTGGNDRLGFEGRIGWDFRLGAHTQLGPFLGYFQVVQPDSGALRPEDGRIALVGVHLGFDEGPIKATKPPPPTPPPPAPPPPVVVKCAPGAVADMRFGDQEGCLDPLSVPPLSLPDRCPDEPEDYVGASDADGCPLGEAEVKVVGDQIVLNDRVYFDFGYARVKHRSWPLLQSLAKLILSHPEYVLVHIYGHTDEIGSDEWNQKLSEDRARAVKKKLVEYGVAEARLDAQGFGKMQPRKTGGTPDDRQENRRVEFVIERKTTVTAGGTP